MYAVYHWTCHAIFLPFLLLCIPTFVCSGTRLRSLSLLLAWGSWGGHGIKKGPECWKEKKASCHALLLRCSSKMKTNSFLPARRYYYTKLKKRVQNGFPSKLCKAMIFARKSKRFHFKSGFRWLANLKKQIPSGK